MTRSSAALSTSTSPPRNDPGQPPAAEFERRYRYPTLWVPGPAARSIRTRTRTDLRAYPRGHRSRYRGTRAAYPLKRARRRISPSRAPTVERPHPPGRSAHRGHAQTTQVREPALRPSSPGDRHIPSSRWPTRILELHRAADRRRPASLADPGRTPGGNRGDLRGRGQSRRETRCAAPDRSGIRSGHRVDSDTASLRWRAATRHGLGGLRNVP